MAAELDDLRRQASQLAKNFRQAGQPEIAEVLDSATHDFGIQSNKAYGLGIETFASQIAKQPSRQKRETLPLRLKAIPLEIEIPEVSKEVYAETRKAVETAIPDVFITPIRPVTMWDLIKEDERREESGGPGRLGFIDNSSTMRATLPPEMEVFLDPKTLRIKGSNSLSTDEQKAKIAEQEAKFKGQLPEWARPFVSFIMADPSTMSQLEDAWIDAGKGLLLPDYFARTGVETDDEDVAIIGRHKPHFRRHVFDWPRGQGRNDIFAIPVGVLPRKLSS